MRHPAVVNLADLQLTPGPEVGGFGSRTVQVARAAGGKQIGASFYEVEPGMTAFPYHWHAANEEAILVVSGTGTLRIGKDEVAVGPGDYVALPAGPDHAHQLLATGSETLRYWCFSTKLAPEIVGYPDSDKVGVAALGADGKPVLRALYVRSSEVDYFHGEPLAKKG